MDSSPASERRAALIREMAQDLNRTRRSLESNSEFDDLTGSHLSVEDESSQAYNSQPVPTQAKRGTRFASQPTQDFVIDTSAIGRAFPDMTGSGSSIDDGSSISIEIGRGVGNGTRNLSEDGGSSGNTRDVSRYKLDLSRLPKRSGGRLREVSTNIDTVRSSPPMKATQYGTSGSSRQSSIEHRHPPLFQATVQDAEDHTGSGNSKNSTQNLTVRSTRFGNGQPQNNISLPKNFMSGKDFLRAFDEQNARTNPFQKPAKVPLDNPTVSETNGGTVQSFMLPNMPNMSELVSGVYEDGTPVFSRKGNSRFAARHKSPAVKHAAVPSIPVPQDEEAIMLSLKLLQEKVAELEKNKAESQVLVSELKSKNRALEDEKKEWRRSRKNHDSGVGSSAGSDAGDEDVPADRKVVIERSRLQSTIRNLQSELDGANRRAAVAEAHAADVTQQRDSAVNQVGHAFLLNENLGVDNKILKDEVRRLEMEVRKYRAAIEAYVERAEVDKTEASRGKATDEDPSSGETRSVDCQVLDVDTPKRPSTRRERSKSDLTRGKTPEPSMQMPKRHRRRVVVEEYTITSDFEGFDDTRQKSERATENLSRNVSKNISKNISHNVSQKIRPASRAQSSQQLRQSEEKDVTQASHVTFLQDGDVTMLRKMLEKEHLIKKGRIQSKAANRSVQQDLAGDITQLTNHTSGSRKLPQKSAMKDLTGRLSVHVEDVIESDEEAEPTHHSRAQSQTRRRHSDVSIAANKGKGRLPAFEDMTSAFILPDITLGGRSRRASQARADLTGLLSIAPPEIVVTSATHEPDNCTICTRTVGNGPELDQARTAEVKIPQPIPVSDRIEDFAADGEDHTTRPSEAPAQALARTIKALEDEFAHMGIQIAELQNIYNELDPSLQKRKRKSLNERIEKLRSAMDAKADQIYALYDVLEGQKKAGKLDDMTEEQLNETLNSVLGNDANMQNLGMPSGIMFERGRKTSTADVTPAKERPKPRRMSNGGGADNGRPKSATNSRKFPWDESYEDEDAVSLPWEGFDDTIDLTQGSRRSNTSSRRRSIGL